MLVRREGERENREGRKLCVAGAIYINNTFRGPIHYIVVTR